MDEPLCLLYEAFSVGQLTYNYKLLLSVSNSNRHVDSCRSKSPHQNKKPLKSDSNLLKKNLLFASMIALQKWWKMLFISS